MSFNTALSGLRAASKDLAVTGNNIANASTAGFKEGRTEFADVVASSSLGIGGAVAGGGVEVTAITQNFGQGTISFTENVMDLAINGNGFFQVQDNKGIAYTRAGQFGIDSQGNIVDSTGANLRGYIADDDGNLIQVPDNLAIDADVIPGRLTTNIDQNVNLDSADEVLAQLTDQFVANNLTAGTQLGVTRISDVTSGNGYQVGNIDFNNVEQLDLFRSLVTPPVTPAANVQANELAAALSTLTGVTASASTSVTLSNINAPIDGLIVNGTQIADSADIPTFRLNLQAAGFVVATPAADPLGIALTVTSGSDIVINTLGMIAGASIDTVGTGTAQPAISQSSLNNTSTTTGGLLTIDTDVNVVLASSQTVGGNVWGTYDDSNFSRQPALHAFATNDAQSYNFASSLTIFDSLGIPHVMTQYYVKEPLDTQDLTTGGQANTWSMYVQIDGADVGGTNPNAPTLSRTILRFEEDGTLRQTEPANIIISNWTPNVATDINSSQRPSPPDPVNPVVNDPATSSNFAIIMSDSSQFGGGHSMNSVFQNGFAQGRLSAVNIGSDGNIFARFTNGESQLLGQVLVADFVNANGLVPLGGTKWAESFQSGVPNVGSPESGLFGAIQSGALEDANTDLSEQLVGLIIAQRNYQANAKTIETINQITQTVINLR